MANGANCEVCARDVKTGQDEEDVRESNVEVARHKLNANDLKRSKVREARERIDIAHQNGRYEAKCEKSTDNKSRLRVEQGKRP
jgi:hypothetical protein